MKKCWFQKLIDSHFFEGMVIVCVIALFALFIWQNFFRVYPDPVDPWYEMQRERMEDWRDIDNKTKHMKEITHEALHRLSV